MKSDPLHVLKGSPSPSSPPTGSMVPGASTLRISEIFYSLQGEGMLVGTPSLFIRLSGCNLRCTWCDTPYASWKPEGEDWPIVAILGQARKSWPNHHIVITGGEPMIFPGLVALTERLKDDDFHITIETAGTVFEPVSCDLMSISPKLSNSTPYKKDKGRWVEQHERLRRQPEVLKKLMRAYDYQLKFVIAKPEDLLEARELVEEIGADRRRVVLMPEGTKAKVLAERSVWLAEAAKHHCYRFSPRLHIGLWGDKRGV
ncbi:MAG: 7-carboxy-7-deazaguanine synthase QueE [Bryobacteraceae bacterium]